MNIEIERPLVVDPYYMNCLMRVQIVVFTSAEI